MPRYPQTILVSCPVPWDARDELIEDLFREEVRRTLALGFTDVYVFGTGGEGYAVDTRRYREVVRVFAEETLGASAQARGIRPMVGAIGLSTPILIERLRIAHDAGFRTFQVSLPSWGPLNDDELFRFFDDVCHTFTDSRFLHYNLGRTKRILSAADYRALISRFTNLVATKTTSGELPMAQALVEQAGELQHFMDVNNFPYGALYGECSLLASYAQLTPHRCRELFEAGRARDTLKLVDLLKGFHQLGLDLWSAPKAGPHMDGAYDKMLCKLGLLPEFPLRLLSPYQGFSDDDYAACRRVMEDRYPDWLPEPARTAVASSPN
jgi:dihydrodipicolinate synthase/N-acetylneuraminate lyase